MHFFFFFFLPTEITERSPQLDAIRAGASGGFNIALCVAAEFYLRLRYQPGDRHGRWTHAKTALALRRLGPVK